MDRVEFVQVQDDPELLKQYYDVRISVFVDEQHFPLDTEIDDYDTHSIHVLLRTSPSSPKPDTPIGAIRYTPSPDNKLARLCVLPSFRKQGYADRLVEEVHRIATNLAQEKGEQEAKVKLHAQMQVIKFYERLGYKAEGEVFDEEGAPHQKMVIRLPVAPSV